MKRVKGDLKTKLELHKTKVKGPTGKRMEQVKESEWRLESSFAGRQRGTRVDSHNWRGSILLLECTKLF